MGVILITVVILGNGCLSTNMKEEEQVEDMDKDITNNNSKDEEKKDEVTPAPVKAAQEELASLKDIMSLDTAYEGKIGVAIPGKAIYDLELMKLVTKHYDSITCENEMKPEAFLGTSPTLDEDGNPKLDFSSADRVLDYVLEYNKENPDQAISMRGHVLLWHSQTPAWFFKEDYSDASDYVSKKTMIKRMDYFFKTVLEHYTGEESKYKGIFYAWDVVNEQIDNGQIRISDGNNGTSHWYQIFKGDDLYIKEAFKIANQYAPKDLKLFYNDYNDTDLDKVMAICELMSNIKAYKGARIDGMGMQAHYTMTYPSIGAFEKAIRDYSAVVDEIQITELDLQSNLNYNGTNKELEYNLQAERYKALFDKMYELDKEQGIDITSVTFWGTHDGASWLNYASFVGGGTDGSRKQCPLLFDDAYQAKPAFYALVGQPY